MKLGSKPHTYVGEEHSRRREWPMQVFWCRWVLEVLEENHYWEDWSGKHILVFSSPFMEGWQCKPYIDLRFSVWKHCLQSLLWQPIIGVSRSEKVPLWEPVLKGSKYSPSCCHCLYPAPMDTKRWCSHSHLNVVPKVETYNGRRASSLPCLIPSLLSISAIFLSTFNFYPLPY